MAQHQITWDAHMRGEFRGLDIPHIYCYKSWTLPKLTDAYFVNVAAMEALAQYQEGRRYGAYSAYANHNVELQATHSQYFIDGYLKGRQMYAQTPYAQGYAAGRSDGHKVIVGLPPLIKNIETDVEGCRFREGYIDAYMFATGYAPRIETQSD